VRVDSVAERDARESRVLGKEVRLVGNTVKVLVWCGAEAEHAEFAGQAGPTVPAAPIGTALFGFALRLAAEAVKADCEFVTMAATAAASIGATLLLIALGRAADTIEAYLQFPALAAASAAPVGTTILLLTSGQAKVCLGLLHIRSRVDGNLALPYHVNGERICLLVKGIVPGRGRVLSGAGEVEHEQGN